MRGRIIKRKGSKNYTIVLQLGLDPILGKRKQQWITAGTSKREAEKQMTKLIDELDSGIYIKPEKIILMDYLKKWLEDCAQQNLSPRSFERYSDIINNRFIHEFGKLPLNQLKPELLQRYYSRMLQSGLSPRSVRYHHAVMHVALQTAIKWGLVGRNVCNAVDPPRIRRREMQTWNEAEISIFFQAAKGTQYYTLFYLALFTGMRRSELLALRWQDVDFVYGQISISRSLHQLKNGNYIFTQPKSERSRQTIALPPSAFLALESYRKQKEMERDLLNSA